MPILKAGSGTIFKMFVFAALTPAAFAADPGPLLQVSTTTAQLGAPLEALAVTAGGLTPDLNAGATDYYSVSVLEGPKARAEGQAWRLSIVPLAVGKLPVVVTWNSPAGPLESRLELDVPEPQLPADAEPADIKRPFAARPLIWPWAVGAILLAAAVWYWRSRSRDEHAHAAAAPPDLRTPAQRAREELAELEAGPLWAQGLHRAFYFQLTEILRGYLEGRYGMPAKRLTTHELLRQLRQAEVERPAVSQFKELFERADLVKFAKSLPEGGQGGLDIQAALRLVDLTDPAELARPPRERR
jgi:hypothetical protein